MHSPIPPPGTGPRRPARRAAGLAARLAAGLLLVGLVAATASAADPAPTPPDTLVATIHTATADGLSSTRPRTRKPADVHLLARVCERDAEPLPAGEYYFGVFDAEGSAPVDRRARGPPDPVDSQGWIASTAGPPCDHANDLSRATVARS